MISGVEGSFKFSEFGLKNKNTLLFRIKRRIFNKNSKKYMELKISDKVIRPKNRLDRNLNFWVFNVVQTDV